MSACTSFALIWLGLIAKHDFAAAESLLDSNDSGKSLAEIFPISVEFNYRGPEQFQDWRIAFLCADAAGLFFEFEVPIVEERYRPMEARFSAVRKDEWLEIHFEALVPS